MTGRRLALAAVLAAAAAGCDAPVVTIRHRLPADVPLAGRSFLVEDFAALGDADADDGRCLARQVVKALSDGGHFSAAVVGQSAGDCSKRAGSAFPPGVSSRSASVAFRSKSKSPAGPRQITPNIWRLQSQTHGTQ